MATGKLTDKPVALIAGVSGAVGAAVAEELCSQSDWRVYGIARHPPKHRLPGVSYLKVDLANAESCSESMRALTDVTHIFYCARVTHAEQTLEDVEGNLQLLSNLVETVEQHSSALTHVHLVQGGKYYGVHVGPFPTPAMEAQNRAPIPNFNYAQQDFLQTRAQHKSWSWTASRPNTLLHYSPDNARNLVSSLGAYAALCRELGASLDFPGPQGAYDSLTQVTSLALLARAIAWMSNRTDCVNQAFNVTNTDVFRWSSIWPRLADAFSMPVGSVRPMKLVDVMSAREDVWQQISARQQLVVGPMQRVVNWGYLDATLGRDWDEILCHNKLRRFGFDGWDDSTDRLFTLLKQYQQNRNLPA